jgi:signal-transduction protein with cAMP-binding, CBS, and nucleotidyltransferase domain
LLTLFFSFCPLSPCLTSHTTHQQATLCEVLDKIVSHRIHRVYIVDEADKPVGVVTCTDVLKLVCKHAHLASKPNSRAASQFGDEQQQQQQEGEGEEGKQQQQQQQPAAEVLQT